VVGVLGTRSTVAAHELRRVVHLDCALCARPGQERLPIPATDVGKGGGDVIPKAVDAREKAAEVFAAWLDRPAEERLASVHGEGIVEARARTLVES
jgi:hypothetical protein